MLTTVDDSLQKLYERLFVSAGDFAQARQYALHLIKKGWHLAPCERRGSIYMQQSAFTTSLVVSYARPFTRSDGWPKFPDEFVQYSEPESLLHTHIMGLRHQVYAHSDSERYTVKPFRLDADSLADIVGEPFLRLSKEQCEMVIAMVDGIHERLHPRIKQMRIEIADSELKR